MAKDAQYTRRTFIRRSAAAATSAVLFGGGYLAFRGGPLPLEGGEGSPAVPRPRRRASPAPPRLAIARGDDPGKDLAAAIAAFGGLGEIVAKGDVVLLKPNVGWDRPERLGANTNPAVLRETARLCLEAGAGKVVVADNSCNNPVRCFDRSGIRKALADLPVNVLIPTERDFVEIDVGGDVVKKWPVLRVFFECDRLINVPVAKHHSSAVLTMGMKNWYGILGGGRLRGRLHQKMAAAIADLAAFARPDLTVLDAFRTIFRNGPQGGSLRDVRETKTVAVSSDPVAVDSFGASLFGLPPEKVPYIPMAAAKGLGTADFRSLSPLEVEA